jgi:hypothetical protein
MTADEQHRATLAHILRYCGPTRGGLCIAQQTIGRWPAIVRGRCSNPDKHIMGKGGEHNPKSAECTAYPLGPWWGGFGAKCTDPTRRTT